MTGVDGTDGTNGSNDTDGTDAHGADDARGFAVGVLLFHHAGDLDVAGPVAVAAAAARLAGDPDLVRVSTVARSRFSVQTAAELTLTPGWAFASAPAYDALVVPGGPGVPGAAGDRAVASYLERARPGLRVLAAVSSGALLLGALGYLRGRRATTHPEVLEELEAHEVLAAERARLVIDADVWTAGPAAAGADLTLELIRREVDARLAQRVAEHLGLAWTPHPK